MSTTLSEDSPRSFKYGSSEKCKNDRRRRYRKRLRIKKKKDKFVKCEINKKKKKIIIFQQNPEKAERICKDLFQKKKDKIHHSGEGGLQKLLEFQEVSGQSPYPGPTFSTLDSDIYFDQSILKVAVKSILDDYSETLYTVLTKAIQDSANDTFPLHWTKDPMEFAVYLREKFLHEQKKFERYFVLDSTFEFHY